MLMCSIKSCCQLMQMNKSSYKEIAVILEIPGRAASFCEQKKKVLIRCMDSSHIILQSSVTDCKRKCGEGRCVSL